jgi:hypothetical protein
MIPPYTRWTGKVMTWVKEMERVGWLKQTTYREGASKGEEG